jgi:hypothetical protein
VKGVHWVGQGLRDKAARQIPSRSVSGRQAGLSAYFGRSQFEVRGK